MGKWKGPEGSNRRGGVKGMAKASGLLILMRRVLNQPDTADTTDGERQCRQLMRDAPAEFLKQMRELEAEHNRNKAKTLTEASKARAKEAPPPPEATQPQAPTEPDHGTERCLELIERLLREYEQSAGTATEKR